MSTESKSAGEAVRVAAALIARDGRLLAARRASGDQAGLWELPGGKLRAGERSDAALRREVREELGCELGVAWLYDTLDYDYPDFHLTMDCFVCRLADGAEPVAHEGAHSELRWLAREELFDVEWLPADVQMMRSVAYYWDEAFADQLL